MAYFNEFPNTRTYDNDLGWLIKKVTLLLEQYDDIQEKAAAVYKFMQDIENGDFPDSVITAFNEWMNENLVDIMGELAKNVFFGLTVDGHFVAYIPESWDEIFFNTTGYDVQLAGYKYGHLVLSY